MRTIQMTLMMILSQRWIAFQRSSEQAALLSQERHFVTRLTRYSLEQLERKHRRGYERHPVSADEFSVWETEQTWGDK